jgi:hypothetical protein
MARFNRVLVLVAAVSALAPFVVNCGVGADDADNSSADVTETEMVDCNDIAGVPGLLPKDPSLTELENIGRCTWVLSTGRTPENPKFQRNDKNGKPIPPGTGGTENLLSDIYAKNQLYVPLPLVLSAKSESDRVARWKSFGVMNDPGCKAASKADEFGLFMDDCKDPFSAGAVGFRKFKNPKFDPAKWDASKYGKDPKMEAPWMVGLTCGACHTSFDPRKPPADPAHPTWDNLIYTIGNQYFNEGELYKPSTGGPTDFKFQVLATQERGTSDTSGIATDHVNNPNAINSIFNLAFRPWHGEKLKKGQVTFDLTKVDLAGLNKMTFDQAAAALQPIIVQQDGEPHPVQSILKGGEDSVGPVGALLRVYINIGMCSKQWTSHFDPVKGKGEETPLGATELYDQCPSYESMLSRVPALFLFLAKQGPIHLADAPNGASFIDQAQVPRGGQVFAENCAGCHSSKQPPPGTADAAAWFREQIAKPDFLEGNFLSDDKPYPVTTIGTNAARALHTNHINGKIWSEAYASQSYSERTWPGPISIKNPWGDDFEFTGPDGGPGYYRTPTLISIWARAPFLHNKALGIYTGDPSIAGRMKAYEDAATKLLNPDKRGAGFIKTTAADSVLDLELLNLKVHVPKGTPVNLFANLDPNSLEVKLRLGGLGLTDVFGVQFDPNKFSLTHGTMGKALLEISNCPDLIEDRGHSFGSSLPDADKKALIEYMKTL